MWIQRTPEEVAKWHEATAKEARSHGRLVAGLVWVGVAVFVAGDWFVSFRGGFATHSSTTGSFLVRLPIVAAVALPFAWFVYRRETRSELAKLSRQTICPQCDTSGEQQAGNSCECGGKFVPTSTVRWVDDGGDR
jgi:hypothetical protein